MTGLVKLHLCVEGEAIARINNEDYRIQKGTFFFDSSRIGALLSPQKNYKEIVIHVGKDDYLYVKHKVGIDLFLIYTKGYFTTNLNDDQIELFVGISKQIKRLETASVDCDKDALFNMMEAKLYFNLLALNGIRWLLEEHKEEIALESSHDVYLLLQNIFASEKAIISVDDFLKGQNIQKRSINDQLKKLTGHSIKQWLNMVSINNCKHCLRTSSLTLKEASKFLGFPDANTFEKYFKRHTGITPTEYRNVFEETTQSCLVLP